MPDVSIECSQDADYPPGEADQNCQSIKYTY